VAICHPKIVETGLDLLDFPTILFHETGYSLHTLRQSSRRSWRIGQRRPVEVKFFAYRGTMQEVCLRLMGKIMLVALAMEGKFASEGLQAIDGDDDMLTAMARELVENKGIGETADSVWRALGQLRPSMSAQAKEKAEDTAIEQGKLIPLRCCRCRSSRFRVQPSSRLTVHRAVPAKRYTCQPTVALLTCQPKPRFCSIKVWVFLQFHPAYRRSDST